MTGLIHDWIPGDSIFMMDSIRCSDDIFRGHKAAAAGVDSSLFFAMVTMGLSLLMIFMP